MKGLVLLAPEGINSTVSGTPEAIDAWKQRLRELHSAIQFKDSSADQLVFKHWSVKLKPETITYKQSDVRPTGSYKHLSPAEWKEMMERDDVVLVDTRNSFEVAVGKFRNAIGFPIKRFHEFPEAVKAAAIPKDKTLLLYCTGGIRCEKAVLTMEAQGYTNVYQLDGGILAYLEQYPQDAFEGECFIFDHRVALDQHLKPTTQYILCKTCGDPKLHSGCSKCTPELVAA